MSLREKLQQKALIILLLICLSIQNPGIVHGSDLPPQIDDPVVAIDIENELLFTGCNAINFDPVNAGYEQRVVELTNDYRASKNLPPLKRVSQLDYASRYHARDMMEDNYFNHDTYDRQGSSLVMICDWFVRIDRFYPNRTSLGENIAAGYSTPDNVLQGWLNSDGHRQNIEKTTYSEIGVGYYQTGGQYSRYWVQDFGRRNGTFPVVINREYAQTNSPDVNLYIYGQGTWDEMRLKNDDGAWSNWQPFQANLNWTLNWVQGTRTVTVEMRRFGQQSGTISSDTIDLTTSGNELEVTPNEIVFIYNQAKAQLLPEFANLTPYNLNNQVPLTWQLQRSAEWVMISPTIGSTPSSQAQISVDPAMFASVGSYQASVTITVTDPSPVEGSPKVVPVRLIVVEDLPFSVFLPAIKK
jgi:uncharacterized protein YkwD